MEDKINKNIKNLEKMLKGLANQRRLTIIKILSKKRELNVRDIAQVLGISLKATSKHLAILRQLDILDRRQIGLIVYYRLSKILPDPVKRLFIPISNSSE